MSAATLVPTSGRELLAVTYFELAHLLSSRVGSNSIVRNVLPLPQGPGESIEYLDKGRALLSAREELDPGSYPAYRAALDEVIERLSSAEHSITVSIGDDEPIVAAAFVGPECIVDLLTLPGGQLLVGGRRDSNLLETTLPGYVVANRAAAIRLLAERNDGMIIWLKLVEGTLISADGTRFEPNKSGVSWPETVQTVFETVETFLAVG